MKLSMTSSRARCTRKCVTLVRAPAAGPPQSESCNSIALLAQVIFDLCEASQSTNTNICCTWNRRLCLY